MQKVTVCTSNGDYFVHIGKGLLSKLGTIAKDSAKGNKVMLISDDRVYPLYGDTAIKFLEDAGYEVFSFVFPDGEQSKNIDTLSKILNRLGECHLYRDDIIVALGGGVVGDISGLAAALYQRGIGYVSVPTTLLAAVDSSVGGKTAVDLPCGKNLCGAFWQPKAVVCDTDTLSTLTDEIFACGMAEVIKYGMIDSEELFENICKNNIRISPEDAIVKCVEIKAKIVNEDEFDNGIRAILNFGHTLGHSVEKLSDFSIPHGEAVAIGMSAVTLACEKKGICPIGTHKALVDALKMYALPCTSPFTLEEVCEHCGGDKKMSGKGLSLITIDKIGNAKIHVIPFENLTEFMENAREVFA